MQYILASQSPRRKELLEKIIPEFLTLPADIDEHLDGNLTPAEYCAVLAKQKCLAISCLYPDCCVIGSDTVVSADGAILGKPADFDDEMRMLHILSGKTHQVYTGVHIEAPCVSITFTETTDVSFSSLSEAEMLQYASTKEPYDKAGGYGIQGGASRFCIGINGDYFNVMGFPIHAVYEALKENGLLPENNN